MDYQKFFNRKSEKVAKDLLGRYLIRNTKRGSTTGRIIETGAYEGGNDVTSRKGMKYAPGRIFLMPFRGHYFLNIATDKKDFPSCISIRKVAFYNKVVKGPGAVRNYLEIGRNLDGILLGNELEISDIRDSVKIKKIRSSPDYCLGYFSIK